MSIDSAATASTDRAVGVRTTRAKRAQRYDIAQREMPLGPKMARLHARRQRLAASRPISGLTQGQGRDGTTIASDDGALAYVLQAIPSGLYVEQTLRRPLQAHLVHHMLFRSAENFAHWCEHEPVRFDHPIVFSRLRKQGDELLRRPR
ncbi:MAG TPA: hypothetical protein VFR90_12780 [Methylibium sp.]|uniref:hypothetical protein n=1 Tax=Methylibium sp. TaxID=2067992 RepID=UPI002DB735B2|nr:hypothetical protein [Methylibium sp.]HEU4459990.1 hypothetical protein [Methylibium sp.]